MECLNLSLKRLQLDYVDLYLIHWPGPAYTTMTRKKEIIEKEGAWYYSNVSEEEMVKLRSETWRAMEDALSQGKVKSIGVSNFSIQHLERLKKTAKVWPPSVNQVESHPLFPNEELRKYCQKEGIVFQAYSSLGGQDGTKAKWNDLLDGKKLIDCDVVSSIAKEIGDVSNGQILLRYGLERNCAIIPKTTSIERMKENGNVFGFCLNEDQMKRLDGLEAPDKAGRLCWRTDPLRMLEFD